MSFNSVALVFNLCITPLMSNGSSYADFLLRKPKEKSVASWAEKIFRFCKRGTPEIPHVTFLRNYSSHLGKDPSTTNIWVCSALQFIAPFQRN